MLNIPGIEDILPRHQEISNGSKKEYMVAFDLIDTKFVSVYLGSEKQTTGYSVDIENRKVTFNSAPTTGLLVTIVRVVPASWESELHGALNSDSLNVLFTKIIASLQTIKEEVNRSLKSNVFDENNSEQKFEFFLKQLADAQDVLTRAENNLSLLETTGQDSLNSINTARDNALEDIEEIRSETISEVIELTDSFLDHDNITNCITEIPQDIKLELNDGTLTLKAGSKLTWGGTEYRTTTTTADQTYSYSGSNEGKALIFSARSTGTIQGPSFLSKVSSGKLEDIPTTAIAGNVYYSTDDMKFNFRGSSGWNEWSVAYPLALVTIAGGKITSIDQIFNGFGFIGSTIYTLPGVKGLIPNGRNEDETLKNVEFTVGKLLTKTIGAARTNDGLIIGEDRIDVTNWLDDLESDPTSSVAEFTRYYNIVRNVIRVYLSNVWTDSPVPFCLWGYYTSSSSGDIISFQPKLPFRAVDWNDFNKLDSEVAKLDEKNIFTKPLVSKKSDINVQFINPNYDVTTIPTTTQGQYMTWEDKNGIVMSYIRQVVRTDGTVEFDIVGSTYKDDGTRVSSGIKVGVRRDGTVYTSAPTPPAGDNSSQIVTSEWCYDPTKSTNLVHRTGNEDIFDVKTFYDAIIRRLAFSGASEYVIRAIDTNNKGKIAIIPYYTSNNIYNRILTENTSAGKNFYFDVTVNDNGTAALSVGGSATTKTANFQNLNSFYVPTPAEEDNSQRAVNTQWMNNTLNSKFQVVNELPSSPDESVFYYIAE